MKSFLKLVAIATVADVVPLVGENRVIVKHGLEGLNQSKNPGLRAILELSGLLDGRSPARARWPFRSLRGSTPPDAWTTRRMLFACF